MLGARSLLSGVNEKYALSVGNLATATEERVHLIDLASSFMQKLLRCKDKTAYIEELADLCAHVKKNPQLKLSLENALKYKDLIEHRQQLPDCSDVSVSKGVFHRNECTFSVEDIEISTELPTVSPLERHYIHQLSHTSKKPVWKTTRRYFECSPLSPIATFVHPDQPVFLCAYIRKSTVIVEKHQLPITEKPPIYWTFDLIENEYIGCHLEVAMSTNGDEIALSTENYVVLMESKRKILATHELGQIVSTIAFPRNSPAYDHCFFVGTRDGAVYVLNYTGKMISKHLCGNILSVHQIVCNFDKLMACTSGEIIYFRLNDNPISLDEIRPLSICAMKDKWLALLDEGLIRCNPMEMDAIGAAYLIKSEAPDPNDLLVIPYAAFWTSDDQVFVLQFNGKIKKIII